MSLTVYTEDMVNNTSKTEQITLRVPHELLEWLKAAAAADRRTLAAYINLTLDDHRAEKETARPKKGGKP